MPDYQWPDLIPSRAGGASFHSPDALQPRIMPSRNSGSAASSAASKLSSSLSSSVKRRRQKAGLTLEELSRRSGVSPTMLSEVERGQKSPTIRIAFQIAEGLECTVSDLLNESADAGITVSRKSARKTLTDPVSGIERHVIPAALTLRGLEVVWYVIPAGRSTGEFPPHRPGVIEHVTVVSGKIEILLGGESIVLEEGDSVTYRADVPHQYRSLVKRKCELMLLIDSSELAR